MAVSFLEYASMMRGCYRAMPQSDRDTFHAWLKNRRDPEHWPGWEQYIGTWQAPLPTPIELLLPESLDQLIRACAVGESTTPEAIIIHVLAEWSLVREEIWKEWMAGQVGESNGETK
jgi:hypothetical protein